MSSFQAGTFSDADNLLLLQVVLFRKSTVHRPAMLDILAEAHGAWCEKLGFMMFISLEIEGIYPI